MAVSAVQAGDEARKFRAAQIPRDALDVSPAAKQVVIDGCQLHGRGMIGQIERQPLNRCVEIEEQRPLAIVAQHALDPEERRERAPRVTGVTLCRLDAGYSTMCPAGSLTEWTPKVSSTTSSPPSYSSGSVRNSVADRSVRTVDPLVRRLADRVVHVIPERLAAAVAVEQRREHTQRQRRRDEQRVAAQRVEDDLTELPRHRMILGQLHVVLGARRQRPAVTRPSAH